MCYSSCLKVKIQKDYPVSKQTFFTEKTSILIFKRVTCDSGSAMKIIQMPTPIFKSLRVNNFPNVSFTIRERVDARSSRMYTKHNEECVS